MLILGISELDNDSGAVLLRDGKLVGAANEERFTRVKQQPGVPYRCIEWLLRKAGAEPRDLDKVIAVRQDVSKEYSHTKRAFDEVQWFSYPGGLTTKLLNYGIHRLRNIPGAVKLHHKLNEEFLKWIRDSRIEPARVERVN